MARIPRLLNTGEATVYHVMSRTALEGYPLGEVEKDYLLELIKGFSCLYLVEMMGFALMGNHFHLLVRVLPEKDFSDEEIRVVQSRSSEAVHQTTSSYRSDLITRSRWSLNLTQIQQLSRFK